MLKAGCAHEAESFSLFARMFEKYERHLYGDLSAMTQVNRAGAALARVIEDERWHARLLNGSDYPLPGALPPGVFQTRRFFMR